MDSHRLALLVLGCLGVAGAAAAQTNVAAPECASVTVSARLQAYGFAHVVTLANRCQRTVNCEVWTNVDPSPHYTLQAKPGQSAEVITRNGSPARDVQVGKQCRFTSGG